MRKGKAEQPAVRKPHSERQLWRRHTSPGLRALVGNVIFTGPHTPTDASLARALPQLFVWMLWFPFLTLLTKSLGEKGKKARMSQNDGGRQRARPLTPDGLRGGDVRAEEDQTLFTSYFPVVSAVLQLVCVSVSTTIECTHTHTHTRARISQCSLDDPITL